MNYQVKDKQLFYEFMSLTAWGKKLLCSLLVQLAISVLLTRQQQGEQAEAGVGVVF